MWRRDSRAAGWGCEQVSRSDRGAMQCGGDCLGGSQRKLDMKARESSDCIDRSAYWGGHIEKLFCPSFWDHVLSLAVEAVLERT